MQHRIEATAWITAAEVRRALELWSIQRQVPAAATVEELAQSLGVSLDHACELIAVVRAAPSRPSFWEQLRTVPTWAKSTAVGVTMVWMAAGAFVLTNRSGPIYTEAVVVHPPQLPPLPAAIPDPHEVRVFTHRARCLAEMEARRARSEARAEIEREVGRDLILRVEPLQSL